MKTYQKLLNPFYVARAARNRFWYWVARQLAYYLARTPVMWGDGDQVQKNIVIGRNVGLADTIFNCRSGKIIVEDEVFFGHHVLLLTGVHDIHLTGMARQANVHESGYDIVIRRGAWVASNVVVLGPCEIGENAVIASGSVVRGTVPPGMIYGGNPAKPIRAIEFR